jgi:hypothetical protein
MNPTIKAGYKTTEFYVTVLTALVGLGVATGFIDPAQAHGAGLVAAIQIAAGLLAMVIPAATYAISRGLAKAPASPTLTVLPGGLAVPLTPISSAPAAPARAAVAPGPTA